MEEYFGGGVKGEEVEFISSQRSVVLLTFTSIVRYRKIPSSRGMPISHLLFLEKVYLSHVIANLATSGWIDG